jgi:DtxR family Mn-dependent transcriptional regulator
MTTPVLVISIAALVGAGVLVALFYRQRRRQRRDREMREDALKHLFDCEYQQRHATIQSTAGVLHETTDAVARLLSTLQAQGLVTADSDGWRLTESGREEALHIVRAHRLWERYLADRTGHAATEWHRQSERQEHRLTPDQANALAADLGHPRFDPHGDPIPTAEGSVGPTLPRSSLLDFAAGDLARIVHVEDEPPALFEEIDAAGLHVGMVVRRLETTPEVVRMDVEGAEVSLTPAAVANISVAPAVEVAPPIGATPLTSLVLGETGRVVRISPRCQGPERRRFLDLGILPGTLVRAEMRSPSGDPTAYRIRGALIGLRREQADHILITRHFEQDSRQLQHMENAI